MQGIPEMYDIPTMRDVSAFTMVRNLIIGSLPRATSRKTKPAERQEQSDSSPPKDAVQRKRYRAHPKIMTHMKYKDKQSNSSKEVKERRN
jgi:hypothetical protein